MLGLSHTHSGMEQLIKSQKEGIKELEAKIQANMEEIKKVRTPSIHLACACIAV